MENNHIMDAYITNDEHENAEIEKAESEKNYQGEINEKLDLIISLLKKEPEKEQEKESEKETEKEPENEKGDNE